MAATVKVPRPREGLVVNRWLQPIFGMLAVLAIANLQHARRLFASPFALSLQTTVAAVQVVFTAFVLPKNWRVSFEDYALDRLRPSAVIALPNTGRIVSKTGGWDG